MKKRKHGMVVQGMGVEGGECPPHEKKTQAASGTGMAHHGKSKMHGNGHMGYHGMDESGDDSSDNGGED